MKKILIFIDTLDEGGVSKVLLDLIENIDRRKYDITVMSLYNQGMHIEDIKKYVKYKYCFNIPDSKDISLRAKIYRKFWGGMLRMPESFMYRWFIKEKYDIEIAFMHGWSTKFISASNNKNSKKIAWVHVDLITWNRVDDIFKNIEHHKEAYSKFNKVICVSEVVRKGIEEKYEVKNAEVLYNPLNKEKILKASIEQIEESHIQNEFNIVTVGRLAIEKGYDRLLKAYKRLVDDGVRCNLSIVGDGSEYEELNTYIIENNLHNNVKLLGYKKNPYKYIKNSDLFVCSSISEGFSLVIVEAMVIGIPVISVDCPGPNELLNFGEYGLLVKNNEENLYSGLKELIIDKKLRQYYRNKSIERSKFFSLSEFINDVENIFDAI